MKVRPLHDKVLIQRLDTEETTKGGIIIPDTAKEKPQEGKVIAVGTGRILEDGTKKPLEIKKGEKVLFNKYGGIDISIDGEDYLILREEDILAVVD
ncbi:MAG: co-chaperone GroES [Candidatus Dadabacteria bacterium]|nr:co-chaperone GroES [Candidatus Dadabacteria bacterium]